MSILLRNSTSPSRREGLQRLAAVADDLAAVLAGRRQADRVAELEAELAQASAVIRAQQAALDHTRKIFERASAAARIGVWECELPSQSLRWSDMVYDIFDLPRGAVVNREEVLTCYADESREQLGVLRSRAIAEQTGFSMDAQITTFAGDTRWIRITATVESEDGRAVRIFGMKQDITEEKLLSERTRYLAEFDVMTGLANRAQFQARLTRSAEGAPIGALLLVDLDGFKQVNDTHGHALGDELIKEAARRLAAVCSGCELVARIGGDEFAVLLSPSQPQCAAEDLAARIVAEMSAPALAGGMLLRVGASVGVAHAEGCTPPDLFKQADIALYAAKAAGRNTYRVHLA